MRSVEHVTKNQAQTWMDKIKMNGRQKYLKKNDNLLKPILHLNTQMILVNDKVIFLLFNNLLKNVFM